ncbi:hypothetical protein JSO61_006060 [Riemerella anatipestifer]
MIKKLLSLTLVILPLLILAQLQSFTVNLTGTPEICPNNGTLSWTTSGTTANSTISYSIYNVTDLKTAVTSTTSLTYVGLPAGTYRVVATQTLGTSSNQATSNDFTIADQKTPITNVWSKVVSNETCGSDGSFRVIVTGGRAPYRYQILDDSNAVVSEFQDNSNTYTFTGLKAANYRYRVIDACGTGLVSAREILSQVSNFTGIQFRGRPTQDCTGVQLSYKGITSLGYIKLPLSIKMEYTNPNTGLVETVLGTDTNMPVIPYFTGVSQLQLKTTTTDACGRTVTQTDNFKYSASYDYSIRSTSGVCPGQYFGTYAVDTWMVNYSLVSKHRVNFISAPQGFDPLVYNSNHGQLSTVHNYGGYSQALPEGTYKYQIIDECGNIQLENTVVIQSTPFKLNVFQPKSCGSSTITLMGGGPVENGAIFPLVNTRITSAPQAFIDQYGALPYTIPDEAFITQDGNKTSFLLSDIPPGAYTISSETTCNSSVSTASINASVEQADPTPQVEFNCAGQFKFIRDSGSGLIVNYQKFFPEKNAWGTTSISAVPSYVGTFTSYPNEWNTQSAGKYRIISTPILYNEIVDNKYVARFCDPIVLKEFEIGATLTFSNAYAFECANGTYDVALSASGGTAPLTYAIVSSEANDATIIKDNGTNPIFEGLTGGTYFFRVYDQCGNFQTRKLDIAKLGRPGIRMVPVCASNELSLVVDGLDYLKYEWTKDGEPNNILSTTNVLNLGTYTADKAGLYHVRISINSATSCINSTLDLKLTEDALTAAKAGTGQTVNLTYDENMGTNLNLFDYLQGNYDGFGTWTETTTPSSSLLIGNQWRVSSAQSGTYSFKYTVTGACGGATDTATVIINLAKVCYKKPVISAAGDALPTKVGITSLSRAGADAQGENWPMVREGGWIALESNTKGFVVNRVPFDTNGLPVGIPVANFVAGMMVYDTTNNCLKVYNGSIWSCFSTQTCPE